jgi:hypothetical protein
VHTLPDVCVENLIGRMRSPLCKTLTLYEARRFAVNNFSNGRPAGLRLTGATLSGDAAVMKGKVLAGRFGAGVLGRGKLEVE